MMADQDALWERLDPTPFENAFIQFNYPMGAKAYQIDRRDGLIIVRVVMESAQHGQHRITIHVVPAESAEAAAQETYANVSANTLSTNFDVPPYAMDNTQVIVWRCRKMITDGGRFFANDIAFAEIGGAVYQLQYVDSPTAYQDGLWIFESVIATVRAPQG